MYGERLQKLRIEYGLTKKEVAEGLGLTPEEYQEVEQNERSLSLDKIEFLASYFETSTRYILGTSQKKQVSKVIDLGLVLMNREESEHVRAIKRHMGLVKP
ncbi:helix-turn-helix domain-containing protein [Bacillus sp. FJAT-44742]|uniref:helix-turn-helix domain-containing protein n=1 Tax=Bacillus sp. FJAT-44742 TaxID=2014005 RepID=UPI000C24CD15|nr:helix-turn-helix transcriptional regulator [Bacillus sp. FJAT-44742]